MALHHGGFHNGLTRLRANNDPIEPLILASRTTSWPDIRGSDISGLSQSVWAELAAGLKLPCAFVFPQVIICSGEFPPVFGLYRRQPRIAKTAIAEQRKLVLIDAEV